MLSKLDPPGSAHERRSKIARNSVFDCHSLATNCNLKLCHKRFFLSTFVDSINVLDCRISNVPPSYLLSLLGRIALERHECSQHAEISFAWPLMSKVETFFVDFKAEIALAYKWHTWQNAVIEWRTVLSADFRNSLKVSNSLDQDQARLFVGPDLGPTCLQRLSAAELGPHCLPTLVNICSRRLEQITFSEAFFFAGALRDSETWQN